MAVSSPRTIEVALSETATPEELAGWKLHAEVTGQVDAFAEDEEDCIRIVREFLSYMPSNCKEEPPRIPTEDPPDRWVEEVMDILPDQSNRVYDMYKIIRAIVDDGQYLAIKPFFGKALITCLARMNGRTVGIIANQTMHNAGAPGPNASSKATSFIVFCDSFNIPLIFLTDTPGNLVGVDPERRNVLLKLIVWLEALSFVTVPKIGIILRKAYGLALSNMCSGKDAGADVLAAWYTADISFMSPEAATNVVYYRTIQEADDPEAEREKLLREMAYANAPFHAAADGTIDDIIDPRDTRRYIIEQLDLMRGARGDFISEKQLQNWPTGY